MIPNNHQNKNNTGRSLILLSAILIPLLLISFISRQIAPRVASAGSPAATLSKTVDNTSTLSGGSLQYTILLTNTAGSMLNNVIITDSLPAELDYVSGTISVTGGGSFGVTNDVITWTGSIANNASVRLQFDTLVTDTLLGSGVLTNTVNATADGGVVLSDMAETTYNEISTVIYMPVMFRALEPPTLLSVNIPTSSDNYASSQATASWTAVSNATGYELEESTSPDFANPTVYSAGSATSFNLSHPATWDNTFYYRVRALGSVNSGWSNVLTQGFVYLDTFSDPASGWAMRREDLDDVDNETSYDGGYFKMKIRGRWDSMIAGPLTPVPANWDSYRIDTRVTLEDGIDNLHSYGIIFGGDWNGNDSCPNSGFTSCFNHYYRVNVIWFGASNNALRIGLKRIDYHDYVNDKDVGQTLMNFSDIPVPDASGWNDWSVEVEGNGQIRLYLNGKLIADVVDTAYVGGGTYFGGFASSDEYLGTAAWYEYYRVRPLP